MKAVTNLWAYLVRIGDLSAERSDFSLVGEVLFDLRFI